jgi:pimeloyl-ACP methyl ester carboxylesterase
MKNKIFNQYTKFLGLILCSSICFVSAKNEVQNNNRIESQVEFIQFQTPLHEKSNETITRRGILIKNKDAVATVVLAHGYMCDKFDVGFLRNMFPYGKFNFLSFDFRAHGEDSKGQQCTLGRDEALDVISAAQYVKKIPDLKDKPLFAYAFSMGAVATIEAQSKEPIFDAMILDCPFDSTETILKKCVDNIKISIFGYQFNIPGKTLLQKYAFHPYVQSIIKILLKTVTNLEPRRVETSVYPVYPVKSIANVKVPCFFIHCKRDEKVSVDAIKSIYASASGPKMLWLTNGRRHYDSYFYNPELYIEKVRSFFDQVLVGKWKNNKEQYVIEDADDTKDLKV